ncbi:amidohydrolase [Cohnella boryungensis]|uniref:Amidohydrolase n=1 Tax=Cohnella boryungensis TaxID=768479 RepID=A0ABV8S5J4_9BACL
MPTANERLRRSETVELKAQLIAWRRHLHQHPELSFQEYNTADFVEEQLRGFGNLEIKRLTPTSVVARLIGAYPGKTLALRADMDALPIHEENGHGFVSQTPGVMHACGHDGHTSMLLAAAKLLAARQDKLHGEIRFIFQHAEEMPPGGARELVEAGAVDGVDWIFGEHLASLLPLGQIGLGYGATAASPDNFSIVIKGSGGHAGTPHRAVDSIAIGAQVVTNLQHIVSRYTDPLARLVVSVTQFTAGASHNVIPDTALLRGTVRCFDETLRQQVPKQIERLVAGIASAHGASYELDYLFGYDPVVNDDELTRIIEEVAGAVVGEDQVPRLPPGMGAEDFSAYQRKVPGTFVMIGAGNPERGIVHPHHHPKFDFDEDALPIGTELFLQVAERLLQWEP